MTTGADALARTPSGPAAAAPSVPFGADVLRLDAARETTRIVDHLRSWARRFGRRGAVVGCSGGVDSSVSLALALRAFGTDRVVPLLLQEKESSGENAVLVRALCRRLGTRPVVEDITAPLEGFGCYRRRDDTIREVFPEFDSTWTSRITIPGSPLDGDELGMFALTVVSPEGESRTRRLALPQYLRIVAATNLKQRTRMTTLYLHAESRNYLVVGTANRNERDQGFFVKYGDGGADVDAIAHLYKSQVYHLAEHLGVPQEIRDRPPTTDTYSAPTTEEEFFFRLPFATMDLLWYGEEHEVPPRVVADAMGLDVEQVERAYRQFAQRRRSTVYLRAPVRAL